MPNPLIQMLPIREHFQVQWLLKDATYSMPVRRGLMVTQLEVADQILEVFAEEVVNN